MSFRPITIPTLVLVSGMLWGADYEAHYLFSAPVRNDPGNEIIEQEGQAVVNFTALSQADSGCDLRVGLDLQLNTWDFDDSYLKDVRLYKAQVPVSVGALVHPSIYLLATLSPGLHSDLDNITREDFRFQGSVLGTYLHSPTLQVILGGGYADDFGKTQFFPIGGVAWQATTDLHVDLVFPSLEITYSASNDLKLLTSLVPSGGEWVWTYDTPTGKVDVDAQINGYRGGLGGEYQVMADGWLRLYGGLETSRTIKLVRVDNEDVHGELDLVQSAFGELGWHSSF